MVQFLDSVVIYWEFDIVLTKFDYIEVLVYLVMLCSVMLFEFV